MRGRTIKRLAEVFLVRILPSAEVDLTEVDLPHATSVADRVVSTALFDARTTAFELEQGPCWRTVVIRLAGRTTVVMFVFDQLLIDGWSLPLFEKQLAAAYLSSSTRGDVGWPGT